MANPPNRESTILPSQGICPEAECYYETARACEHAAAKLRQSADRIVPSLTSEVDLVRRKIRARRERDAKFPPDLFGEPAWDLLLGLFLACLEQRRVTVTNACNFAAVPPTTALRWLATLGQRGLVQRYPDPRDSRRVFVELSDFGQTLMQDQFHARG